MKCQRCETTEGYFFKGYCANCLYEMAMKEKELKTRLKYIVEYHESGRDTAYEALCFVIDSIRGMLE